MNFKKRNNKMVQASMERILVASGNQALITGDYATTGNTVNVGSGQLGVESADIDSATTAEGTYITAGNTALQVKAVQAVQGTPLSGNLSAISAFKVTDEASIKSSPIIADRVVSVKTVLPTVSTHDIMLHTGFTAPTAETDYKFTVTLQSHKRDLYYTAQKRDQVVATSSAATGLTNTLDWLLQDLATQLNTQSILTNGAGKPFMVVGINDATPGSVTGTALGTIAAGDSLDIMTWNGITYSYTATTEFVASLTEAIAADASLSLAELLTIDVTTAGAAAAAVDSLLVIGLDEPFAAGFDDSIHTKVRVEGATDLVEATRAWVSRAKPGQGDGRVWREQWYRRMGLYIKDLSNIGHDYDLTNRDLPQYIDSTGLYTSTTIEYYSEESTLTGIVEPPHRLVILLPAAISNPTADADTGYTIATTATTTVTQLNAALGAWLSSASDAFSNIQYLGNATQAAPFQ